MKADDLPERMPLNYKAYQQKRLPGLMLCKTTAQSIPLPVTKNNKKEVVQT
jgi:hypothetical protein